MNQENRNKVLNYLNSENVESIEPLVFDGYESIGEEFTPREFYTVDDMVRLILTLMEDYTSVSFNDREFQTRQKRWRSCLDIWRHIKYYNSNIEIFDIMHSLYNIKKECGGQYCTEIERRTFRIKGIEYGSYSWNNNQTDYISYDGDEFGLLWEDWENI